MKAPTRQIAATDTEMDEVKAMVEIALRRDDDRADVDREAVEKKLEQATGAARESRAKVAVVTTANGGVHLTMTFAQSGGSDVTVTQNLVGEFDHGLARMGGDLAVRMSTLPTEVMP